MTSRHPMYGVLIEEGGVTPLGYGSGLDLHGHHGMMGGGALDMGTCGLMGQLSRSSSFRQSFRRGKKEPFWIQNIRQQLGDQLKCLDGRLETHMGLLYELQDFYRRRAEIEQDYSKNLDRLVKQIMTRHKTEKTKREYWPGYSTYTCWQYLLQSTKRASTDHATIGDIYAQQMTTRFTDLADDIQRIYKKCREIGADAHEEILKVLTELQSAMKTYHLYHGESKAAEAKLKEAQTAKSKVELTPKGTLSKKFRNYEKQTEKRQQKYQEAKMKAVKARNEYLLCLDSTNASIHKYFVEDLHNLVDCMDCGYHNTVQRALMTHVSAEESAARAAQDCMTLLSKSITGLDQRSDKQKFLELYHQSFALPKKFEFQAHKGDEVRQISAQKPIQEELLERITMINSRLHKVKVENDEVWKTLETAERSLMEIINQKDYDVSHMFSEDSQPPKSPHEHHKKRADRMETEAFYIDKFKTFLHGNNLIARLQAKSSGITKALGEGGGDNTSLTGSLARPPSLPPKPKKQRRLGKAPLVGQPKLFGGSIEEYCEATNTEIPLVVSSCIRTINLHGMHHQGVFRVSGSLHEINDTKAAFERGEDPLRENQEVQDINSIAGVLKLYFRELREPLFPTQYFDELMSYSQLESTPDCIHKVKELIGSLPRPIFVVMRYLFYFLNHLSTYTDENMMDPYNLAICFGPTLLPIPGDRDQVQFQGNVIELMRNIIIHCEDIFPNDGQGIIYEKCMADNEEELDVVDSLDHLSDDEEGEIEDNSEEEVEEQEATAQYDFVGRTDRELTFKKGAHLKVYNKVSSDWWEGSIDGRQGLVPDKYIHLGTRESEDRSSMSEDEKRRSTESLPAKPFALAPLTDDDKSLSQPNIAALPSSSSVVAGPPPQRPPRLSTTSTDSGKSNATTNSSSSSGGSSGESPTGSLHSLTSKDSAYSMSSKETLDDLDEEDEEDVCIAPETEGLSTPKIIDTATTATTVKVTPKVTAAPTTTIVMKTTEDLHNDIDSALAEVMSGLQSLEMQQNFDKPPRVVEASGVGKINIAAKHTPDLVLDLPLSDEPPSPKEQGSPEGGRSSGGSCSSEEKSDLTPDKSPSGGATSSSGSDTESSSMQSTAEVFANSNQSTIKKGQTITMLRGGGGTGATRVTELSQAPLMRRRTSPRSSPAKNINITSTASPPPRRPAPPIPDNDDDDDLFKEPAEESMEVVEQVWQPQQARVMRVGTIPQHASKSTSGGQAGNNRPLTPERSHSQYDRAVTPDKPSLPSKPNTLPRPSPDRGTKPTPPPLRTKPALHKKPGKSPEVLQKLREGTLGSMDSNA